MTRRYEMELVNAVQITPVPKKEKVAIIGCADSKNEAPWHLTEEFEFWGVNNLFLTFQKPFTRWFDIHQFTQEGGKWFRRGKPDFRGMPVDKYLENLGKLPWPVYMQQSNPLVPNAIPFPFAAMVQAFGSYFTNSISWQIALGIAEGFKELHVYGVDMAVDCLAPETKVLTADLKWVQIGDVKVGDELMGCDEFPRSGEGISRKWRKAIVLKSNELVRPCYEIGLDDGTEFIASEAHGWLAGGFEGKKWLTSEQLLSKRVRSGRSSHLLKMVDYWEHDQSWESGYIAGAFDGEGCLSQHKRENYQFDVNRMTLSFAQRDNAMQNLVVHVLDKHGFKYSVQNVMGGKGDTRQFNIKGGRSEIMRFLGTFRPPRLMEKFDASALGELKSSQYVDVVRKKHIGNQKVIGLRTDCKTFISQNTVSHNSEYFWQRPSCEYFLGMAVGKGIKVFIPDTCDLMKTRFLYGAQEAQELPFRNKIKAMQQSMHERRAKSEQEMQLAQRKMFEYNGALAATTEIDKIYKNVTGG
jgi:hypothetical protein